MYSLDKFAGRIGRIGKPLPDPFPAFTNNKIKFRLGATSMIAGRPGSYKSIFALNMIRFWSKNKHIRILVFAADSDEATVAKRLSAIITGEDATQVETKIVAGETGRYETCLHPLADNVRFVYNQLSMDGIADHVWAFEAQYGTYPDIIVLDNLIDFVDRPDDWGGMLMMTKELDALAKETRCHVVILHHARVDQGRDKTIPPMESEIQGKITQIPRLVLTVAPNGTLINMSCEKDSGGPPKQNTSWMQFQVESSLRVVDSVERNQGMMTP